MRTPGDMPRIRRPRSKVRIALGITIAVVVVVASLFRAVSVFYTDFLWFDSIDLTNVWSKVLVTKIVLGVAGFALFFVVLWINFWVVDRVAPAVVPLTPEDEIARHYSNFVRPRAARIRTVIALVLAGLGGSGFASYWNDWMLFRNGGSFGVQDPQFKKDVGFFVFKLPFLTAVVQWVFVSLVFAVIASLAMHWLRGAIRPQAATNKVTKSVMTHVGVLLGLLALVRAAHYYLERFRLSYSERGVVTGANYTDVNVVLPALTLLILISLLAAVLFFWGARTRTWSWPVVTVALWAAVSVVLGTLVPFGVQELYVSPAESQKEGPYIQRNIDATRLAMNINNVDVKDFSYTNDLSAADLNENAQTIRNVRLWDPELLKPSYQRLQESRSFFQFNDVDIDRYEVNNATTQMMLSVRELSADPDRLPSNRKSWVNQHLAFTHGYGAVASPANAVTTNGEPDFVVKDLPPTGSPEIKVPQVYFGEGGNDYSIVNTDQGEVDYTSATGQDQLSKYQGEGGVKLDSVIKRATFAARVGNLNPLISGLINKDSKAMYLTNIRDRQMKVAPFLKYDNDPYPVLLDGRIKWVQDAYTITNNYPYASEADTSLVEAKRAGGLKNAAFNYVRNSVKIVTDAYDGNMTFYVVDQNDPVIKAWQKTFPGLFTNGDQIPAELRDHLRYPEDVFRVQTTMYGQYHLNNSAGFYSNVDRWNIAQKPTFDANDTASTTAVPVATVPSQVGAINGEQRIEPYYLLMRLPNEQNESFLMFQPFVPYSPNNERKELSAFMVAKSDPADYGKLQAYVMPPGQQIDGPALVEAKIQQDPTVSQYITLLSRAGSQVALGNMSIIPVDNSLLYIRPLYVQAQSTKVPEFKKAIVVQGDKIAMGDTLQQSLAMIFGSAPQTLEQVPAGNNQAGTPAAPGTPSTTAPPANVQSLLDQANNEFAQAEASLRNGDLAGYQQHVQRGADLAKQARAAAG